jgi:hypothetical protein
MILVIVTIRDGDAYQTTNRSPISSRLSTSPLLHREAPLPLGAEVQSIAPET